ncbi:rhamnogalacturonate lyase B [Ilyonectria robusta]|uniref:rhamnogalacturonate lyase B n=1 Tax=Ilyonectria robusta TaxID=1079257 RepID=UPI001E8CAF7B|nr:rhamnogalacturonate lyase B [Ilyonectria robusta]KAH8650696.1 rhamnogalacturonate lyase B [Ilyonectria robusta]
MRVPGLSAAAAALLLAPAAALLRVTQSDTQYILENDDLSIGINKKDGAMGDLALGGQDLVGTGRGPYLDCHCTPEGQWTPGNSELAEFQVIQDVDSSGTPYGAIVMTDTFAETGQTLSQYWFLREGETGLHLFTRATYHEDSATNNIGELRTMFRPQRDLWTHIYGSEGNWAPLPQASSLEVQDSTTYYGNITGEPFADEYSDFFSKYAFSDQWRDHKVHGMYTDGTQNENGESYGSWVVHNHVDTYYGGPLHSDIMVDGIVYDYIVSSHHGARTPNTTSHFDRTFGPSYRHFNKGGTLDELAADAAQYADPTWNADFYDDIAKYVPNYATSDKRTTFKAKVKLPNGAKRPIAVLAENRQDFQNNTIHPESLQFWGDVDPKSGNIEIPRVAEGTYRLTVYADAIFGQFTQDDVEVSKSNSKAKRSLEFSWKAESAGKEIWRIGTPDKSAAEFKHGSKPSTETPLQPEEYRLYWAKHDFPTDFPDGVNFKVGESDPAEDFNYIHWSRISEVGNFFRDEPYLKNVNNWTIRFDLESSQLHNTKLATFTVQIAGLKTGTNNPDFVNLPYTLNINGADVETWVLPWYYSTSCGVRSAVSCYNFGKKFAFSTEILKKGENSFVLSLPYNASSIEPAQLPWTTYLQYDALRLEFK